MFVKWYCFVLMLLMSYVRSSPLHHDSEKPPSFQDLTSHMARVDAHSGARLPLPTPQEIEAIKKVAQILVMLGEQVIPTIIGEPPSSCEPVSPITIDVPQDPVDTK